MNTRALVLVLLLVVLVVSVPREANMVLADLVAKMASGDALSPAEVQAVRLGVARVQSLTDRMSAIVGEGGPGLHSDVFRQSGPFAQLPHEGAILSAETASGLQAIPHNTWTSVVFARALSRGLMAEVDNKIYVQGNQAQLMLFMGHIAFADSAAGMRGIRLETNVGSFFTLARLPPASGLSTIVPFAYLAVLDTNQEWWRLEVFQNSGGDLDVHDPGSQFVAVRIR